MPNIPPLTLLRPRLDNLLGGETLVEKDSQTLKAELDAVFDGLKAYDFLPVLLRAYHNTAAQVQSRIDEIAPEWLGERGYVGALLKLLERRTIHNESRKQALIWLEGAGADLSALQKVEQRTHFYRAYTYADDSQGLIEVFWYTDDSQRKVQGMNFLIDINPPWEGAVKDITAFPSRSPEKAIQEFVDIWKQRDMRLTPVGDSEVKKEILKSLEVNRREGIRLPRDLIEARNLFLKYVLTLPDTPETPLFTAEDFDELSRTGKSVEVLREFEQRVGRRVRLQDGKELWVLGSPFDQDDW
ncbi:MAG: hypothetical protein A3F84_17220 [Candidatus Handelsmanbacteria bacterium RIFCSPLOWO2_12_FULL_64_10]|uniref:Uncharacterized protein n=1 Tax=Handelsmanbacteria sp. (strain RIFCSPLOWO2_12_FULL_64_10) TaxID=1817868 RepID=A0A1F6C9N8_HANXR|nr:MAG: hypothetical protein A3F84_17220 [Candidatus Handelsmanbacteria bacterium RIFCSPLOWO2_12_FULL_64_10]